MANCELSWVSTWANDQNWMHTETDYDRTGDIYIAKIVEKKNNRLSILCPSSFKDKCGKVKSFIYGKNQVCKDSLKKLTIVKKKDGENLKHYIEFNKCEDNQLSSDDIVVFKSPFSIHIPKVFKMSKQVLPSDSHDGLALSKNLEKVHLSWGRKFPVDISKAKVVSQVLHSKLQSDLSFMHIFYEVPIKDIGTACDKGCKDLLKKIKLPISYIKKKGKPWKIFATPRVDQCSGYSKVYQNGKYTENRLELRLVQEFGVMDNYIGYDYDHDGQIDVFSLVPRIHLKGTKQFYRFVNDKIKILSEICFGDDLKYCRSPAGC